jgi:acyl-CoA reductase-like NAD-dependent aldehyde dehydrogenase
VRDALKVGRAAFPAWAALGWQRRVELLRKAFDAIREKQRISPAS